MYSVKAYRTDHYDRNSEVTRSFRSLESVIRWAMCFLADGGKVVVYCLERKWSKRRRMTGRGWQKIFVWTSPADALHRNGWGLSRSER